MTDEQTYSLRELADLADVTPRTVRYYIAQGLLPSPGRFGPGTRYGAGHLARLRLIKQLQHQHLPLAEIRARLEALGETQVARLGEAARTEGSSPVASLRSPARLQSADTFADAEPMLSSTSWPSAQPQSRPTSAAPGQSDPTELFPRADRSQWDRISLSPNVELHVRRPLSRSENRRVERLLALARELIPETGR
jgi:DNA-binding transcriptional MerR regulator